MTSSADLTAAGGAWVAIGIMDDKHLHDEGRDHSSGPRGKPEPLG